MATGGDVSGLMQREFGHIVVTQVDCIQLRELCPPIFKVEPLAAGTSISLFEKVAIALLRFEEEPDLTQLNMPVDAPECIYLNNQLHEECYTGVHELLVQTWKVMYELENNRPYVTPGDRIHLDPAIWGKDSG